MLLSACYYVMSGPVSAAPYRPRPCGRQGTRLRATRHIQMELWIFNFSVRIQII